VSGSRIPVEQSGSVTPDKDQKRCGYGVNLAHEVVISEFMDSMIAQFSESPKSFFQELK